MKPRRDVDVTGAGLEITASTPLDQLPQFITPEELARILRIGKSLAYELCKKKELRCKKVGRCVRISHSQSTTPHVDTVDAVRTTPLVVCRVLGMR